MVWAWRLDHVKCACTGAISSRIHVEPQLLFKKIFGRKSAPTSTAATQSVQPSEHASEGKQTKSHRSKNSDTASDRSGEDRSRPRRSGKSSQRGRSNDQRNTAANNSRKNTQGKTQNNKDTGRTGRDRGNRSHKSHPQRHNQRHGQHDQVLQKRQQQKQKHLAQHANWRLEQYQIAVAEGKTRFHDLDLPDALMHALADLGFEYCSPIQAQVLPHTLDGYDAVGKAQTGTGKTAAFLLAAMNECLTNPLTDERFLAEPRVVVLAPTRELVLQIAKDAQDLAKYSSLNVQTLVGGMDFDKQLRLLESEVVDIVAATPGRLIDFISRGHINLGIVDVLVLDEADRMLDMGFIPQVRRIVRATPHREQRQTMLFSATFNYDVNIMIESWMVDPVRIEIEPENVAADTVDQRVYMVGSDEKYQVLKNIVCSEENSSVIVFANRRDQTRDLYEALRKDGVSCGILSGEVAQQKRTRTLQQFKNGTIKVLVATDVAGRGIHIDDISHVVNYNLPEDPEDYVHRIGRTGRAGATGISISLACEDDAFMLPDIEKLLGQKLVCEQPPAELLG